MSGVLERAIVQLSPWSKVTCLAFDVATAGAAEDSRIAIDSREVGSAVPADRFGAHAISVVSKPGSPRISRMIRMGKAAGGTS